MFNKTLTIQEDGFFISNKTRRKYNMKKLFSIISVLLITITLAGCTNTEVTQLQEQLTDLQTQLDLVNSQYAEMTTSNELNLETNELLELQISQLEDTIIELEDELEYLNSLIFDSVITITLDNGYGDFMSTTVGFNDDYDGTLFDLLDDNYDVEYTESEYGKFITGVDYIQAQYGSYISFSKNEVPSMVGVEAATYEDGDLFSFEIAWWDTNAQMVDAAIQLFIINQADEFINTDKIDYNVFLGLDTLGLSGDYVSQEQVMSQLNIANMTTWNEFLKAAYILDIVGVDNSPAVISLNNELSNVPTFGYASALSCMISFGEVASNFSTFEETVKTFFTTNTPYDLGVDSGGMAVSVLSAYDTTEIDTLIAAYSTWIDADQLASGGFATRDSVYGEVTYPGSENASSISQIILALVANGLDPMGVDYTQGENNLVSRLIEFQNTDGSFDYLFGDENADLMFSTPQSFLALVAYQQYLNTYQTAYNPYIR